MLKTIEVALRANVTQYTAGIGVAAAQTKQFAKDLTDFSSRNDQQLRKVGMAAGIMGAGMLAGFGLAANAAMGFDKQMSEVGAVSGATAGQLGDLRQAALDAGKATVFSASQAAEAESELAKAGVSTGDILGGALRGSLDLASAGSLDLARSAEIAANAMTIFKLKGSDVPHVADVLAAGANKSAASVDEMAQALQQGGLVASQLGIGLEDTSGTLAMFAQAGLRGSDAGTSLKTMLMSLTPKSKEAAEMMDQLGLSFFDTNGEFVGLDNAAQQLRSQLGGLSQEQRFSAMQTIFGTDAIRAANILYEQGADGVHRWSGAVNDAGYASELARQKTDNLAGDLEQLRGSLETALIKGGSQGTTALRWMAQSATSVVNAIADMPSGLQATAVGFMGVAGAALTAGGAAATLVPKYKEMQTALQAMGPGGLKAASAVSTLTRGIAAGAIAVAGITAAWTLWNNKMEESRKAGDDFKKTVLDGMRSEDITFADLHRKIDGINTAIGDTKAEIGDSSEWAFWDADYRAQLGEMGAKFQETGQSIAELQTRTAQLADAAGVSRDEMLQWLVTLDDFGGGFKTVTDGVTAFRTAQLEAAGVDKDHAKDVAKMGDAYTDTALRIEDAKKELEQWKDAVKAQFDPLFAMSSGLADLTQAQLSVKDAEKALADARREHGWTSIEAAEADQRLQQAQMDLLRSNVDLDVAARDLATGIQNGTVSADEAKKAVDSWTASGRISADQAKVIKGKLDEATWAALVLDQQSPIVSVGMDDSQFQQVLARITGQMQGLGSLAWNAAHSFIGPPNPNAQHTGTGWANGGILFFAGGGEHHSAQIAAAGSMRVWAEPETGGEAYIPLSPAKRQRSTMVLSDVAQRFGYTLNPGGGGGAPVVHQHTHHHSYQVNLPHYMGDRQEVIRDIKNGLRELERSMEGRG